MQQPSLSLHHIPLTRLHGRQQYFSRWHGEHDADDARLLESLRKNGLLIPLAVNQQTDGEHVIIDSYRRYRAAQILGWETVPCIVHETPDEGDVAFLRIILNETHRPKRGRPVRRRSLAKETN